MGEKKILQYNIGQQKVNIWYYNIIQVRRKKGREIYDLDGTERRELN